MDERVVRPCRCTISLTKIQQIIFFEDDPENPRAWPKRKKLANVAVIASMASMLDPEEQRSPSTYT